ncbi:fungal-specific transcription factor domain-containing protein [Talaromyces proteolyticus]|uniref:Fungal-specific transcription factor domain-containing protein n=1 Tax=Talaromyces proteolyticus TaxID=1131652 RepID=A0AAD4Q1W2_9EURO|nr:fungal-specific transcription factor domain-containing protein [Talaromyces proteolyticus]KAH8703022.1 fungal-specific transcription factor domain-containing protein [Talaromyces proteolyticus]
MSFNYHTLPACNRCRKRKSRCDIGRPLCGPCKAAGTHCEFMHATTGQIISRSYIYQLETQLGRLEAENNARYENNDEQISSTDNKHLREQCADSSEKGANSDGGEGSKAHADLIMLGEVDGDAHFLGLSSGIHLARAVLESAAAQKKDTSHDNDAGLSSLADEDSRDKVQPNHSLNQGRSSEPTSVSSQQRQLPSREVVASLIEIFFSRCQFPYAILEKDELIKEVAELYDYSSLQPHSSNFSLEQSTPSLDQIKTRFMLYMVLAIALLSGVDGKQPEELVVARAKSYYSNAIVKLTDIIQSKDERSLQCLLLFLFYSLQHSTSAPIWYISGLSVRMCIDLGLHTERAISLNHGSVSREESKKAMDRKRRLFWTTYSLDQTFSLILGRPFAFKHGRTDVEYPSMTLHESQRAQFIHWLQLQELQNEIISQLYLSKGDWDGKQDAATMNCNNPQNDFLESMERKLNQWKDHGLEISSLEKYSHDWWTFWYFNTILLLKRPSPRNPVSTDKHMLSCYSAAISIIQIAFVQLDHDIRSMTFTWSDVHHVIMAGITFLFTLWDFPEARVQARKDILAVRACLGQLRVVIDKVSIRWPQIGRTQQVLKALTRDTIEFLEYGKGSKERRGRSSMQRTGHVHAEHRDSFQELPGDSMQPLDVSNHYSPASLHDRNIIQSEAHKSDPKMFRRNIYLSPHSPLSTHSITLPHTQLTHNLSQEKTTCTLPAGVEGITTPATWSNHNIDQTNTSDRYAHAEFSSLNDGNSDNNITDQQSLWDDHSSTLFPGNNGWVELPWDSSSNHDFLSFDMMGLGLASRFNYLDLFGNFSTNEQAFPYNISADNLIPSQGSYKSALNFQRSPNP